LFDITFTGIKGNFRPASLPVRDRSGKFLTDQESWTLSRNQQRNWETVNQIMSLRCLPQNITDPVMTQHRDNLAWKFEFDIENIAAVSDQQDLDLLRFDCDGVPMITGLQETADIETVLMTTGDANIWFDKIDDK
jgi:hypothetical protein